MAPFVEANSLSSITQLASNPPRYPRNPTEPKKEPLVLYIARVPGSHDIILTPFKPGLKNVTAEDVASSLYYLHLQRPDDEALLQKDDILVEEEEVETEVEAPPPVPDRKPVPHTLPPLPPPEEQDPPTSPPKLPPRWSANPFSRSKATERPSSGIPARKPVHQQNVPAEVKASVERHPLGPRPLQTSEPLVARKQVPGEENQPFKPAASYGSPGTAEPRSSMNYQVRPSFELHSPPRVGEPLTISASNPQAGVSKAFSITIIRRDVTSGAQWNIGFISNDGEDVGSPVTPTVRPQWGQSGGGVSVRLVTPGYNQFKAPPPTNQPAASTTYQPTDTTSGFIRQVYMEGSQTSFWDRKVMRGSVDLSGSLPTIRGRSGSASGSGLMSATSPTQPSPERPKPKCYVFTSPWNGRCEFSTRNGGRSLKCKHTLPNNNSGAAPISELRFNLPSAAIFSAPIHTSTDNQSGGRAKRSKMQHIRNKLSHSSNSTSSLSQNDDLSRPPASSYAAMYPSDDEADDSDDEHLGLSLGREAAGGGNRGKRAKLGKLIVYDEGLKMVDLVVAANMGIWWETWDP